MQLNYTSVLHHSAAKYHDNAIKYKRPEIEGGFTLWS